MEKKLNIILLLVIVSSILIAVQALTSIKKNTKFSARSSLASVSGFNECFHLGTVASEAADNWRAERTDSNLDAYWAAVQAYSDCMEYYQYLDETFH